jgi:hypothetical protein
MDTKWLYLAERQWDKGEKLATLDANIARRKRQARLRAVL